jgi:hypothetical protein
VKAEEAPPAAGEAGAALPAPGDGGIKKRPLDDTAADEAPLAKQPKTEEEPSPTLAAAPAPGGPRVRANQNHPAALALRKRSSRKAAAPAPPPQPEVLFPVGRSAADVPCPRRMRSNSMQRQPRNTRAAWGRLKQVGWWLGGWLTGCVCHCWQPACAFGCA